MSSNHIPDAYTGTTFLSFLCPTLSLSVDKVNFLSCQLIALLLSFALKKWIHHPKAKLIYCLGAGVFLCFVCFGLDVLHVIASALVSYAILRYTKSQLMPWIVLGVSMAYLAYLHIKRQFFLTGSTYCLDITGPFMVMTERVTSLAFSVRDGREQKKDEGAKCTELQKRYAIRDVPDLLQYCSFSFQFQSMLAGPLVMYADYMEFIYNDKSPSPLTVVIKKALASILFAVLFLSLGPLFYIDYIRTKEFLDDTSIAYKMFYLTCATALERTKYYHAWIMADAVCNASGLGYDSDKDNWDLVTNVYPVRFELAGNLKETLDVWNIGTMKWLRFIIYERCPPNLRTILTYVTSAMWHGYFPGYYITFFSGALFTEAARTVRKYVRPLFVKNGLLKSFYDVLTWFTTRSVITYVTFSFVILDFAPSMVVLGKLYFFFHIAAFCAYFILPRVANALSETSSGLNETTNKDNQQRRFLNNVRVTKSEPSIESSGHYAENAHNNQHLDIHDTKVDGDDSWKSRTNNTTHMNITAKLKTG